MSNGVTAYKPAFFNQPKRPEFGWGDIWDGAKDVVGAARKVGSEIIDIPSNVADFLTPEAAEDFIGAGIGKGYGFFKAAVQGAQAGQSFVPQLTINYTMTALNYTGFPGVEKKPTGSLVEQLFGQPILSTEFGQLINQSIKAATDPDKSYSYEELFGSGFFIRGKAEEEMLKVQQRARPTTSGGRVLTPGRALFGPLTEMGVIEEGSTIYNIGTGITDMAAYLKADPTFSFRDAARLPGQVKGMYRGAKDMASAFAYSYDDLRKIVPPLTDRLKNFWWGKADDWAARRGQQFVEVLDKDGNLIRRVRTERATPAAQQASEKMQQYMGELDTTLVLFNDAEFRATQLAPEVQAKAKSLMRQEGAMFHGSKMVDMGELVAIDDPRYPSTSSNLFGPGIYVTDNPMVATSYLNYEPRFPGTYFELVAPYEFTEIYNTEIPPGMSMPGPVTAIPGVGDKEAGSITRFQFKEGYTPTFLDGDKPLPPEIIDLVNQRYNLPEQPSEIIPKLYNYPFDREVLGGPYASGPYQKLVLSIDPFRMYSRNPGHRYGELTQYRQRLISGETAEELSRGLQVFGVMPEGIVLFNPSKFISEYNVDPSVAQFTAYESRLSILENRGGILSEDRAREIARIGRLLQIDPEDMDYPEFLDIFRQGLRENAPVRKQIDEIEEIIKYESEFSPVRNELKALQELASILNIDINGSPVQVGKRYFDAIKANFHKPKKANIGQDANGDFITDIGLNTVLRELGYDGIQYAGGIRIGGYGDHTAKVIFNLDNLEAVDVLTGERLPVNDVIATMKENNELQSTISNLRGQVDDLHTNYNTARDIVRDEAGLPYEKTPGRKTLVPTVWEKNRNAPWIQPILQAMAAETDPATIWRIYLRGNAPALALDIAKAKTVDEVWDLVTEAVKRTPTSYVGGVPVGTYNGISELGFAVKQASSRYTRQFQTLPENLFIPFDDMGRGVKRFDDLAGALNMSLAQRNKWTTRLMEIYQSGETGGFFEFSIDFANTIIKPALKAAGISSEEARVIAKFKNTIADVTTMSLRDVAADPAPWNLTGFEGPLRTTQLMSQGMYLFDPTKLRDVIQATGTLGRMARRMENVPIAGEVFKANRFMQKALLQYSSEIWKPSVVIGIKHMLKVVPDEIMRTLLTGTFESPAQWFAAVQAGLFGGAKGKYTADVFGQTFNLATDIGNLELEIASLREITEEISKLRKAGKIEKADEMAATFAEELAEYPMKLDELAKLQAKFNSDLPKFTDAMIGNMPEKAIATGTNSYLVGDDIRHGFTTTIQRGDLRYRDEFVAGIAHQTGDMYNNPIYRRVANGRPFDEDKISVPVYDDLGNMKFKNAETLEIETVTKTYGELLKEGSITSDGMQAIEQWILFGAGKEYYLDYFKKLGRKAPGFMADAPDSIAAYVRLVTQEIYQNIGTNQANLDVLATGLFNDQPAFFREPTGRWVAAPEYEDFLRSTYVEAADSANQVLYFPKFQLDKNPMMSGLGKIWDAKNYLVAKYFQGMYGQTSDLLARSPLWRGAYWDAVEATLSTASQKAIDALRASALEAGLPKSKLKRLQFALDQAEARVAQGVTKGGESLEAIDKFANAYATNKTVDTLYDSSKRSLFGYQHQLLFPFFEAFREQAQTYMKFVAQRPELAYWAGLGVGALQGATAIGPGDVDYDGKPEGFLYRNAYGNEVFAIPMTGAIARFLTGTPTANYEVSARQMSMIGQIVPGVGFTVQIPLSYFNKLNDPEMSTIAEIIFPMGRPEDRGSIVSALDPRPLWLRRMAPLVGQLAGETPVIGQALKDFTKVIFGNQESTVDYKQYYNKVLQAYSSTIPVIKTEQEMSAVLKEVETKTNILFFMRGLTQAVIASPTTNFMLETKQGDIRVGFLSDKLRQYEDEAEANGANRYDGTAKFLAEYGTSVWALFGNITKSKIPGLQATEEYDRWAAANKELLDTFPDVAGYFGPMSGDFSPSAYSRQKYRGMRESTDPRMMLEDAQSQMGYFLVNTAKAGYDVEYLASDEGQSQLRNIKEQVKSLFPFWDGKYGWVESAKRREKQIQQLQEIANSPFAEQSEVGKMVKVYMGMRDFYLSEYQAADLGTDWTKNANAEYVRIGLTKVGDQLARMVPQFAFLWQNVLAPEFEIGLED